MSPLTPEPEERAEHFATSFESYSTELGKTAVSPPTIDLTGQQFDRPLLLHMAALAASLGKTIVDEVELLDYVLAHEQRYWNQTAEDLDIDRRLHSVLGPAVAVIALSGGCDASELPDLLTRIPVLADRPLLDLKAVSEVFTRLYLQGQVVEALQPDLLGERHVVRALEDDPSLRGNWFEHASEEQIHNSLTVLNRAVAHSPIVEGWLEEDIGRNPRRFARPAMAIAVETGDPIGRILAKSLEARPNPELARELEPSLPDDTVALRELGAVVTDQALNALREVEPGEESLTEIARLLSNLGNRRSKLGRTEVALQAVQESVDIRRRLAETRPDAFLPDLAMSLNNLGNRLSELGRREEALHAAQEAVDIRRRLAETRPDAFLPNLALSLNNLGNRLSELGRREEALHAAQEAVDIRRRLAETRPDAFLPNLALSLNNLGPMLSELGRREEALQAAQEAVDIYRRLAETRPDAFLPNLALSLNNLGGRLSELGRREEALHAAQEAVDIRRRLAETRPDAFLPNLAMSLNNLGNMLGELGRREEALQAAQEAVDIRRRLAETRPDAFLPNLAMSLNNLGTMLSQLGRREEALQAAQEAVRTLLPFFERLPAAYARWMATMAKRYVVFAEENGSEGDQELMRRVMGVFKKLEEDGKGEETD